MTKNVPEKLYFWWMGAFTLQLRLPNSIFKRTSYATNYQAGM